MPQPITVMAYQSNWTDLFLAEAEKIQRILGSQRITIHHIGSTAVPGLRAKPVTGLMPVVEEIEKFDIRSGESGVLSRAGLRGGRNIQERICGKGTV